MFKTDTLIVDTLSITTLGVALHITVLITGLDQVMYSPIMEWLLNS